MPQDRREPILPKPSEQMRANRPYLFSDSQRLSAPRLERSLLEYHLETLVNRKEEYLFEDFCRRIAEAELCPNLKPQAGPLGGGDSKTDSSTYPVSTMLLERCYWGTPAAPATERWAFAFSCQKTWTSKVRSDCKKIAELDTKFSVVYFITSQFARDKTRARLEEELSKTHEFEVHILDREWLCTRVLTFNREHIAIETLRISVPVALEFKRGPKDTERQLELDEVLNKLREPLVNYASDDGIASAYLQAGFLSRELELPRHETTGFFQRARSIAKKSQNTSLIVHCAYHHAWTDNWWYDDVSTAIEVYNEIERFLGSAPDAHAVEKFCNLLSMLWCSVVREEFDRDELRLLERDAAIRRRLNEQVNDHPDVAVRLQAETMLAFGELSPWQHDDSFDLDEILRKLTSCFARSQGIISYPLTRFTDTVIGLSEHLIESPEFDAIFDLIQKLTSGRDGEIAEARLLIRKGEALQKAGRLREAASAYQQARYKAAKEEGLETSVTAADLASTAFISLGLPNASRQEALFGAYHACKWTGDCYQSSWYGYRTARMLAWTDLSQGRLASFIRWMQLATNCFCELYDADIELQQFAGVYQEIEKAFCNRLYTLNSDQVKRLVPYASQLQDMQLPMSRFTVLYLAGLENEMAEEFTRKFEEDVEWMRSFFAKWKSSVRKGFPETLLHQFGTKVQATGNVRDSVIFLECKANFETITYSDDLLGTLESLASLCVFNECEAIDQIIRVEVFMDDQAVSPPQILVCESTEFSQVRVRVSPKFSNWIPDHIKEFRSHLVNVSIAVLCCAFGRNHDEIAGMMHDVSETDAFDRALDCVGPEGAVEAMIGRDCYLLQTT